MIINIWGCQFTRILVAPWGPKRILKPLIHNSCCALYYFIINLHTFPWFVTYFRSRLFYLNTKTGATSVHVYWLINCSTHTSTQVCPFCLLHILHLQKSAFMDLHRNVHLQFNSTGIIYRSFNKGPSSMFKHFHRVFFILLWSLHHHKIKTFFFQTWCPIIKSNLVQKDKYYIFQYGVLSQSTVSFLTKSQNGNCYFPIYFKLAHDLQMIEANWFHQSELRQVIMETYH